MSSFYPLEVLGIGSRALYVWWKSTLPWSCILGPVCLTKYNLHSCFQKNRPQSWPYFLHRILYFFRGLFIRWK